MKKRPFALTSVILCSAIIAGAMSACGKESEDSESLPKLNESESSIGEYVSVVSSESSDEPTSKEVSQEELNYINPLTGLPCRDEIDNCRPVAITINNIAEAQPLMGVSKADAVYECLVEGGITRLLAVYKDVKSVGTIGSIRSARPVFIDIAYGYNGVYVHCGTSTQAEKKLAENGSITATFDLGKYDWAWRDQERLDSGYAGEHTLVTDGETLARGISDSGTDMNTSVRYPQQFGNCAALSGGFSAEDFSVIFSGYKSTSFKYDSKNKVYNVLQYGDDMYDSTYATNVTVQNVIVISVRNYMLDDEHVGLEIVGNGTGYYINGGKAIKIKWSKLSEETPINYTIEDGKELIMNPGRQYICCVPPEYGISF